MTMTITLKLWWIIPVLLFLAGLVLFIIASKQDGMFGGIVQTIFGMGCWIGALACVITAWII